MQRVFCWVDPGAKSFCYNKRMRKIITITFITLDGVMQAPRGPEEGVVHGDREVSFSSDEMMDSIMRGFMSSPFELLLGKASYDIFASLQQSATTDSKAMAPFNSAKKY